MINGNIDEFIDKLRFGEELIFIYNGRKYFSQGYCLDNGQYRFELQQWEHEGKMFWHVEGLDRQESFDAFMAQQFFDRKTFMEVEQEIEWVDF